MQILRFIRLAFLWLSIGIDWKITKSVRIKTEVYYQHLYNIPVTPDVRKENKL